MNYLAHALLGGPEPDGIAGGILGDFVKGRGHEAFPSRVRAAILEHRAIDRYTDGHSLVRTARGLIARSRRRFAGIAVDLFFDHFLARHWAQFCSVPLEAYTAQVYAALAAHEAQLPARLRAILPRMEGDDWLAAYRDRWAVEAALSGIARRFARPARATGLPGTVVDFERHYGGFEHLFLTFFPELLAFHSRRPAGEAA